MSATLTWASSGNGTKTNTTNASLIDDIDTLVTSFSGNAAFSWQTAGKSNSGTPRYLLLSRKDGSAGRIGIIIWDSAPAANNAAILDGTPTSNALQFVWFPNGTGTTLSNLTAASGTICGNDTGVVKCAAPGTVASIYGASFQLHYFDCADGMVFGFCNPAASNAGVMAGAGVLVVDASDVAYDCTFANTSLQSLPSGWLWTLSASSAGSSQGGVRTNYGASNRWYMPGWSPGAWVNVAAGTNDLMNDTTNKKAWFPAISLLLGTTSPSSGIVVKGEGSVLKLRQIAYGPNTTAAFATLNSVGPVAAAIQICNRTAGSGTGQQPWVTNFKV